MPANLPPHYHEAEQRFREASTPEEKLAILQEMMAIIPKFTQVLSDLGVALPLPTRLLIGLSAALVDLWPWILGGMGGVVVAIVLTFRRESARLRLDILLLKLPVVGELLAKNGLARLAYVLGALLRGGIPIVDALDVAARTAGNRSLGAAIVRARREILAGKGISEALATDGAMPALVLQMIAIGEATGNLDEVLVRIAELYDQQVARVTDVNRFSNLRSSWSWRGR